MTGSHDFAVPPNTYCPQCGTAAGTRAALADLDRLRAIESAVREALWPTEPLVVVSGEALERLRDLVYGDSVLRSAS